MTEVIIIKYKKKIIYDNIQIVDCHVRQKTLARFLGEQSMPTNQT